VSAVEEYFAGKDTAGDIKKAALDVCLHSTYVISWGICICCCLVSFVLFAISLILCLVMGKLDEPFWKKHSLKLLLKISQL